MRVGPIDGKSGWLRMELVRVGGDRDRATNGRKSGLLYDEQTQRAASNLLKTTNNENPLSPQPVKIVLVRTRGPSHLTGSKQVPDAL